MGGGWGWRGGVWDVGVWGEVVVEVGNSGDSYGLVYSIVCAPSYSIKILLSLSNHTAIIQYFSYLQFLPMELADALNRQLALG